MMPTRFDQTHDAIVEARNRGVAALLVSEDLRTLVISDGQLVYAAPVAEADIADIGHK